MPFQENDVNLYSVAIMRKINLSNFLSSILLLLFILCINTANAQTIESLDIVPELFDNSEQMSIVVNGKKDGLKNIVMGPYAIGNIQKMDTGSFKIKFKEGKSSYYSPGDGYEEFKIRRTEEKTYYLFSLGRDNDSTETLFSLSTVKREQSETVLGMMFRKQDARSPNASLDNNKKAEGYIMVKSDSSTWHFFIDYPYYNGLGVNGYITNGFDSLTLTVLYSTVSRKKKKEPFTETVVMKSPRGISVLDSRGNQVGVLVRKQSSTYIANKSENFTGGEKAIIGQVNSGSAKLALVTLYTVLLNF